MSEKEFYIGTVGPYTVDTDDEEYDFPGQIVTKERMEAAIDERSPLTLDTGYIDLVLPVTAGVLPASSYPTWNAAAFAYLGAYSFAVGDLIDLPVAELPHAWIEGDYIYPHLHGFTHGVDTSDRSFKFTLYYAYANCATTNGLDAAFNTGSSSASLTIPASTATRTAFSLSFPSIHISALDIGAQFRCRILRSASGGTEPTLDPYIDAVGLHVRVNALGSSTAYSK